MARFGAGSMNLGGGNAGRGEKRRNSWLGRGRGRLVERVDVSAQSQEFQQEFQQEVLATYDTGIYNAVMRGDSEAVKAALYEDKTGKGGGGTVPPPYFSQFEAMMQATNHVDTPVTVTTPAVKPTPKKAAMKTNGYCLFMKHRGRETNTQGTINELMGMFDKDWKSLSEEDKKMWKERAKSGWQPDYRKYDARKGGGKRAPQKPVKEEKDYDTGEEEDEFY